MPHKTRPVRIERLSPPELSQEEISFYLITMAEGIVQALEAYPAFFTEAQPIWDLATKACRETDERKRAIYLEAFVSGYIGFRAAAKVEPREVLAQIAAAKKRSREQTLLFYLAKAALSLSQS
jgi:hypothetical protein